jgi:hypothetical protein
MGKLKKKNKNDWFLSFVIILVVLVFATYYTVFNYEPLETQIQNESVEYLQEKESYEGWYFDKEDVIKDPGKRYWDHMPLTYRFNDTNEFVSTCQDHIKKRLKTAFDIVKNETQGIVYFVEVDYNEDIIIHCSNKIQTDGKAEQGISTAGEGGPTLLQGNKIIKGELNLYPYRNCGVFPDVELHEIGHVLGFGHNKSSRLNLMYPINLKCDGEFDIYIRDDLIEVYA